MTKLKIYLFGSFEVKSNDEEIQNKLWQSRQVRQLLKILVVNRNQVVSNDQLFDIIWPGGPIDKAKRNLYVRISQLRKLLQSLTSQDLIRSVEGGYIFNHRLNGGEISDCLWVDVDAFELAADRAKRHLEQNQRQEAVLELEKARDLCRGDYLAEDIYEDWTIIERERLRERRLVMLTELAEAYAQLGFYRRAINECQQILIHDPWREAVYTRLMLYHYYSGNKSKALQTYALCKNILMTQLGLEADPQTTTLARQIETGQLWSQSNSLSYPPPAYEGRIFEVPYALGEVPFTGRDREYTWLVHNWHAQPQGVIWISGEAGVGKTRLIETFINSIQDEEVRILKFRGNNNQAQPYAAWVEGLRKYSVLFTVNELSQTSQSILELFIDGLFNIRKGFSAITDEQLTTQQIQKAIQELLSVGSPSQTLFWFDDAHLLDHFSLDLIQSLLGEVTFILSSQTGVQQENDLLNSFVETCKPKLASLILSTWTFDATQALLLRLGGEGVHNLAQPIYTTTEGNPLYVIASLQYLFEKGTLYVKPDGGWALTEQVNALLPPSIEAAISTRLNEVQAEERSLLDVIAVAGGACDYELLQRVLAREENSLLSSADELIRQGILKEPRDMQSADVVLTHALYEEILNKTLPKARQRIYHRRIGEAMLTAGYETPAQASILADHFYQGADYEKAIHYARVAGDYALSLYAPQQALTHFQNALDWHKKYAPDTDQALQSNLLLRKAEALRLLGNYELALQAYQTALPHLVGELKSAAIFQIFNLKIIQGEPLSVYESLAQEYLPLIEKEGETRSLAVFHWARSYVALLRGNRKETRLHLVNGWRSARRLRATGKEMPSWICQRAYTLMIHAYLDWGNYHQCLRLTQKILSQIGEGIVNVNTQAVISSLQGEALFHLGQYESAEILFKACHSLGKKAADPRVIGEGLIRLGNLAFARGDFSTAEDYAHQVFSVLDSKPDVIRLANASLLLAKVAISSEDFDQALVSLENILAIARFQESKPYQVRCLTLLTEIHYLLSNLGSAETIGIEASETAKKCGLKYEQCNALHIMAKVKEARGAHQDAIKTITHAYNLALAIQSPLQVGRTLKIRAQLQTDANTSLHDATTAKEIFTDLGAAYEMEQTNDLINRIK